MSNQIMSDLYDLAVRVKRDAGAHDYLDKIAKQVTQQLLALPDDTDFANVHMGRERTPYNVHRRVVGPSVRRSLDRPGLRENLPTLAARALKPKPKYKAYSIYFGRNEAVWKRTQAEGAERCRAAWAEKTAKVNWAHPTSISQALFDMRVEVRRLDTLDKENRVEMSHLIERNGLPTRLRVGEGSLEARDYNPGFEVDWNLILLDPRAKPYISYHPTSGSSTIVFREILPDPWEGE